MKHDYEFRDEAYNLAIQNNISIIYTDKYVKGCRAKGPRNWGKVNYKSVQYAIKKGYDSVNFWRG